MGIDIYLNGYEAWNERSKSEREAFDQAVKLRDSLPQGSPEAEAAQTIVSEAANKMLAGRTGYLRSSYNGSGLFRVLEEIFGFDVAAYLLPGEWEGDVAIDGHEFVVKVENLQKTAVAAMSGTKKPIHCFIGTFYCFICKRRVRVYEWMPERVLCAKCKAQEKVERKAQS